MKMRKCKLKKITRVGKKPKGKSQLFPIQKNESVKPYKIIGEHKSVVMNKELRRYKTRVRLGENKEQGRKYPENVLKKLMQF